MKNFSTALILSSLTSNLDLFLSSDKDIKDGIVKDTYC